MGRGPTDEELEDQAREQAALAVARQAGVLELCTLHEEYYDAGGDIEGAYKLGNYLITKGDPLVAVFGGDRKALTDLLEGIEGDYPTSCSSCDRHRDD